MIFASQKRGSLQYPLINKSIKKGGKESPCLFQSDDEELFQRITRKMKHLEDGCQDEEQ